MTMPDERPAGPPTLDRRVERLEREMAESRTSLALIRAEQDHIREIVTTKFGEQGQSQARIEATLATLAASVQSSTSDPAASPLGRALVEDMATATRKAEAAELIASRVEKRLVFGAGVIGVIVWMAGIFGPTIAKLVFGLSV